MKNKLTIEQELEIIKMKNDKIPLKNILIKFNIKSKKTIYDVINRNGRIHKISNKKYEVNENYFDKIDTEEKSYWLGFLYADGYVRLKYNRSGELKLKLKKSDESHIILFNKCLSSNYPIKNGFNKVLYGNNKISISEYSTLSIYNTKIVKDLMNLGCLTNKTFKIILPNLDEKLMNHFIRGYFDGDGCIHKLKNSNNTYKINILGNDIFIKSLQLYLINKLNNDKIFINKKGKISSLNIGNNFNCLNIKQYFYKNSTIYLKRKKEIFDKIF